MRPSFASCGGRGTSGDRWWHVTGVSKTGPMANSSRTPNQCLATSASIFRAIPIAPFTRSCFSPTKGARTWSMTVGPTKRQCETSPVGAHAHLIGTGLMEAVPPISVRTDSIGAESHEGNWFDDQEEAVRSIVGNSVKSFMSDRTRVPPPGRDSGRRLDGSTGSGAARVCLLDDHGLMVPRTSRVCAVDEPAGARTLPGRWDSFKQVRRTLPLGGQLGRRTRDPVTGFVTRTGCASSSLGTVGRVQ